MSKIIDRTKCIGCGTCMYSCPLNLIIMDEEGVCTINQNLCTNCGFCEKECPVAAINEQK